MVLHECTSWFLVLKIKKKKNLILSKWVLKNIVWVSVLISNVKRNCTWISEWHMNWLFFFKWKLFGGMTVWWAKWAELKSFIKVKSWVDKNSEINTVLCRFRLFYHYILREMWQILISVLISVLIEQILLSFPRLGWLLRKRWNFYLSWAEKQHKRCFYLVSFFFF